MSLYRQSMWLVRCDGIAVGGRCGSMTSTFTTERAAAEAWAEQGGIIMGDDTALCDVHASDVTCGSCGDSSLQTIKREGCVWCVPCYREEYPDG